MSSESRVPKFANEIEIVPLTAAFCAVASVLHTDGFEDHWSEDEMIALLDVPGAFGFLAFAPGNKAENQLDMPLGFIQMQTVLDEAEINTIVVTKQARKCGVARKLLSATFDLLRETGIGRVLLEVADDNTSAIALYRHSGFVEIGRRKQYYRRKSGRSVDALVMERDLGLCVLGWDR